MHVHLAQVPRGEGTDATWSRRARRAHGGNRRGRERRILRELAEPAAAPPMLRESSDGEGGSAPHTRPWPGRDGPLRQRRRVAVVPPDAPPSRAPSAAGYAADKSSVQSGSVWSDFFSPGSAPRALPVRGQAGECGPVGGGWCPSRLACGHARMPARPLAVGAQVCSALPVGAGR